MKKKKVYLTLANGKVFEGYRFGADGEVVGELVFSTGMVGYVETLTDPNNFGQIVVQTFPLIGNYGVMPQDAESKKAWVSAYVVREVCETPSNFRCEGTLDDYLKEQGVIGVYGVDTRELTKILREEGAMNAKISQKPIAEDCIKAIAAYETKDAVKTVSNGQKAFFVAENATCSVALWDFGAKRSTINNLLAQNWNVIVMPANASAEEVLATGAHGVILSDGPGNPNENTAVIEEIKKIIGKVPVLGLGLGHQLFALAMGASVKKQKYGHRGGNQPVKCTKCGKVYISTQNHGYEVVKDTIKEGFVKFVNVNDGSCEGIDYDEYNAFTVQFAPEACSIGNPENPLYKKFFALMKKENENA
ncbi:MAG: carbamoyl phosphate synthase small subunit [Clostridiales bacterium]|nr:carbamoyl phosphate synthase small subunit [Clostridiales bacterium]